MPPSEAKTAMRMVAVLEEPEVVARITPGEVEEKGGCEPAVVVVRATTAVVAAVVDVDNNSSVDVVPDCVPVVVVSGKLGVVVEGTVVMLSN